LHPRFLQQLRQRCLRQNARLLYKLSAGRHHGHPYRDRGTRFGSVCRRVGHRGLSKNVDPSYSASDSTKTDGAQLVAWPIPQKRILDVGTSWSEKWRPTLLALPEVRWICNHFNWKTRSWDDTSFQIACRTCPRETV
jgi:hypothetical protein